MRALLDTSVLIATDIDPVDGDLAISAISLAELHFGVLVATTPPVRAERLRRLSIRQRRFDAIPADEAVAVGQLVAAVASAGRRPRPPALDLMIAATAHAHSARPYTTSTRATRPTSSASTTWRRSSPSDASGLTSDLASRSSPTRRHLSPRMTFGTTGE